jgi:hypothetical protein
LTVAKTLSAVFETTPEPEPKRCLAEKLEVEPFREMNRLVAEKEEPASLGLTTR